MWISTDPALGEYIPKAPVNKEAKKYNQNLPGMGGVFNHINGNLYHYAGNNPVCYTDPNGEVAFCVVTAAIGAVVGAGVAAYSSYKKTGKVDGWKVLEGAVIGGTAGLVFGTLGAQAATSTAVQAGNCLASFAKVTGFGAASATATAATATAAGAGVGSSTGKLIFDFDQSKVMSHIFSADHIKNGIMKLGNSATDIFNKIQNIVSGIDPSKVKDGSNFMVKTINGIETTIRFFVKDGKVINMDAFIGTSARALGNLVD